jgi:hypothetical protein
MYHILYETETRKTLIWKTINLRTSLDRHWIEAKKDLRTQRLKTMLLETATSRWRNGTKEIKGLVDTHLTRNSRSANAK